MDLDAFVKNIFKMFDLNNDRVLTFEEFTFATSAQNYDDPKEKLYWLFDNVYDKASCSDSYILHSLSTSLVKLSCYCQKNIKIAIV